MERYDIYIYDLLFSFYNKFQLDSRRAQREARTVNIWPPSPKAPARDLYAGFFYLLIIDLYINLLQLTQIQKIQQEKQETKDAAFYERNIFG